MDTEFWLQSNHMNKKRKKFECLKVKIKEKNTLREVKENKQTCGS